MTGTLETPRLRLRTWASGDFEAFAEMSAEPDVMRFLGDGQPLSREKAWQAFSGITEHWQLRGYGLFVIEEKASGKFVGRAGPC